MKNCKTFYETQTASHVKEIVQIPPPLSPPHQIKVYYVSGTKIFLWRYKKYTDICFQSASRMQFLECSSRASRNGAVQMFFLTRSDVCWEICKVKKVSGCVARAYFFQRCVS